MHVQLEKLLQFHLQKRSIFTISVKKFNLIKLYEIKIGDCDTNEQIVIQANISNEKKLQMVSDKTITKFENLMLW